MRNVEPFRRSRRSGRDRFADPREPPDAVVRLNSLLDAATVDPSRVGREIRSYPELESLVIRMAMSLALSPADSVPTLDEAVAVLGADRLRVVLYMWSLLKQKTAEASSFGAGGGWSPEALYLASFLRYLGLDSPDAAILHSQMFDFALDPRRAEFTDLRDMLMRDFLALMPILDPSLLKTSPDTSAKF